MMLEVQEKEIKHTKKPKWIRKLPTGKKYTELWTCWKLQTQHDITFQGRAEGTATFMILKYMYPLVWILRSSNRQAFCC